MKFNKSVFTIGLLGFVVLSHQNCSMTQPSSIHDQTNGYSSTSAAALEAKAMKVIQTRCVSCHSAEIPSGGIGDINSLDALLYYRLVVPGEPALSDLYRVITEGQMPPGKPLSNVETKAIFDWIQEGFSDSPSGIKPPVTGPVVLEAKFASINTLILQPKCLGCHNGANPRGGVSFSNYNSTMNTVQAGRPDGSSLYTSTSMGRMPQGGARLTSAELAALSQWITAGALNN